MKVSYNWLKDFLPELSVSPEEVAKILTFHTAETTVSGKLAVDPNIQVVKITAIDPHPNADRLRLATITNGDEEIQVVCGAPNIEVGQVVPYSPPGTVVKDADGNDFEIGEAKIRGIKSPGMLNSLRELGLHHEHAGIWILPADLPLGSKLADHIPEDAILTVEVTPNRAHDLLSHRGVARELSALLGVPFKDVQYNELPPVQQEVEGIRLTVEDVSDTPRYIGMALIDAKNGVSPMHIQARLLAAGSKPISRIVDITNYVMYEIGNPSHSFDKDTISGTEIGVRRAKKGEVLTLLDESEQPLSPDIPVITVDDTPVAAAGVMGGLGTGIAAETKRVFLEVANFRPYLVQESSRTLRVRSEASARFEKGISPALAADAAGRLLYLYTTICEAQVVPARLDSNPKTLAALAVEFRPESVEKTIGIQVELPKIKEILTSLRFQIDDLGDFWNITPPIDRLDVAIEQDVVEEVIRVIGLDAVPSTPLTGEGQGTVPPNVLIRERVRDVLVQHGFTETYNQSFEPGDIATFFDSDNAHKVELLNPAAPELSYMRTQLLSGLVKNTATNKDDFHRKFSNQERALFEIGHVYSKGDDGVVPGVVESEHCAGIIVGEEEVAKNALSKLAEVLGVTEINCTFKGVLPEPASAYLKYRLPVYVFEFSLTDLYAQAKISDGDEVNGVGNVVAFTPYSHQPSVYRDISLQVPGNTDVATIEREIRTWGGELLVDAELFDEFKLPGGDEKAIAYHVEYKAMDRTLTDDEVEKIHKKVSESICRTFDAKIR